MKCLHTAQLQGCRSFDLTILALAKPHSWYHVHILWFVWNLFFFFLHIVLFWGFLYLLMKVKYRGDGNSQVFHNWKVFVCTPELLVDAVTAPQASEQTVSEDLLGTKRHFTLCARHLKQDQMSKSDCVWSGFMMTFISLGKNLCVVLVTNPKACVKSTSISNV